MNVTAAATGCGQVGTIAGLLTVAMLVNMIRPLRNHGPRTQGSVLAGVVATATAVALAMVMRGATMPSAMVAPGSQR